MKNATGTSKTSLQALIDNDGYDMLLSGGRSKNVNRHSELIDALYADVEPLCKTNTENLWDWLYEGEYTEGDTIEYIAAEWDEDHVTEELNI